MRRRAKAFLDYTRAGPLKWLVMVAELDGRGSRYSVALVAEYAENDKKTAQSHVKQLQKAIDWKPASRKS